MNLHKLYLSLFLILCLGTVIVGAAWRDHVREDAHRDAVIETQQSDISGLEQRIAAARNDALAQIAALDNQRKALASTPQRAREVIRELVPMQSPIQQMAPLTPKSPPDAPSALLTKQQEIELAQYAISCKQCSVERDQIESELKDQQEIISRQKVELNAAKKSAKGGSIWQRTVRIAKWGAIFGGLGYAVGRTQR
ncbi:MAG: hypothetical protein DMG64_21160 [Acidobacteria bacterium]|nr:MAG: hypothetical protein DMG64_21160 [Acidobacteriota bacterium]PYY00091.1 MAG: hypothetical protein DMG63_07085 [Acidobacteriota bacterium]PYY23353.1 MAG: hypothetical protein DMG62_08235 [Acidobacteriota bacterium]